MTVGQLEKLLSNVTNKRTKVTVDLRTLDNGNDCWSICSVESADLEWVYLSDDNGGVAVRKDGTERGSTQFVLRGER